MRPVPIAQMVRKHGAILSFVSVKTGKRGAYLVAHKANGVARIAHGKALTDAHDGVEARFGERANLLVHHGIGFAKIVATLRMAHDAPSAPTSLSMGMLVSPVKAPEGSQWQF